MVRSEFSNWRDEQRSWRETCALLDQSHHMTDLYVQGPEALKLFSDLGVNSFKNFKVNQAKQFVACNHDGYVIGDAILFYLDENKFNLVGRPPAHNWVQYNLETRGYKATAQRDERSAVNQGRAKIFPLPDSRPECTPGHGEGHRKARTGYSVLQHGCIQHRGPGCPRLAPWNGRTTRMGIVRPLGVWRRSPRTPSSRPARNIGIRQVGARAYPTTCLESGWIPSPLPAIYAGEEMKEYRQWLSTESYEAKASLGGSFYSDDITDYYLTPYELGYGPFVKFDHDFVGRQALEKMTETRAGRR